MSLAGSQKLIKKASYSAQAMDVDSDSASQLSDGLEKADSLFGDYDSSAETNHLIEEQSKPPLQYGASTMC